MINLNQRVERVKLSNIGNDFKIHTDKRNHYKPDILNGAHSMTESSTLSGTG